MNQVQLWQEAYPQNNKKPQTFVFTYKCMDYK